jgi:hypothetical protein
MRTRTTWLFALASVLTAACASSPGGVGTGDDDVKSAPTRAEAEQLFSLVDDNCAGNNNGWTRNFSTKEFRAEQALNEMRDEDKDASGVDCSDQHDYSTSRESGVEMFRAFINDETEDARACLAEHLTPAQRTRLDRLVSDPTNLGVFASIYSGGDNPEGCSYYTFRVYRADGLFVEMTFNYTD